MSGVGSGISGGGGGSFTGGSVASPILFPDGTAGAPSISFNADTDTGLYRTGSNEVGFSSGGSLVYRLTNTGLSAPVASSANGNSLTIIATDGNGTDKNGGSLNFKLGNKTGSGTAGAFNIQDASSANLFKFGYDNSITLGSASTPTKITVSGDGADQYIDFKLGNVPSIMLQSLRIRLCASNFISFDSDEGHFTTDFNLRRTSDHTLALGCDYPYSNPASFEVYNLGLNGVSPTNYERFAIRWASNVCYLESVKGGTGTARNLEIVGGSNLNLTAPNQILFNSAGDYMRMGNAFLNLSSAGGLYFCSETTATTTEMKLYRSGTRTIKLSSDLAGDDTDRPMYFSTRSCEGPNLISGLDIYSVNGTTTLTSLFGGAYGGSSTLNMTAGGQTLSISTNATLSTNLSITGSMTLTTAGNGLKIKEGSNATMGVATLVAGTVTVSTTAVTANSRIFLTPQTSGGTPGFVGVSARSAGTSFTITGVATDTSTIAWMIVEPA